MNNESPLRFDYKLPAGSAMLMVLAPIAITLGMVYLAQSSYDEHFKRSFLRFISPSNLSTLFWSLAAICGLASIYVLSIGMKMSNSLKYVELGPEGAFVPSASMSMSPITIPYQSIRGIQLVDIQKQKIAIISSSVGEARLNCKCFPTPNDFTTFVSALQQRCRG